MREALKRNEIQKKKLHETMRKINADRKMDLINMDIAVRKLKL